jgi:Tat protein secretion system quality control protein TatD with DNase activity
MDMAEKAMALEFTYPWQGLSHLKMQKSRERLQRNPYDYLLIETDAYLTPEPFREKEMNHLTLCI